MKKYRILVINPGSTSTKVSLFEDETSVFEHKLFHEASVLLKFSHVNEQPLHAMTKAGLAEQVGKENFCDHIDTALLRAAELTAK